MGLEFVASVSFIVTSSKYTFLYRVHKFYVSPWINLGYDTKFGTRLVRWTDRKDFWMASKQRLYFCSVSSLPRFRNHRCKTISHS